MKSKCFIIADSIEEINGIADARQELMFTAILISSSVPLSVPKLKNVESLHYYDELIDSNIAKKITEESNTIFDNWHTDLQSKMIARIDGLNLAQVLFPSVELIVVANKRYVAGLGLLLENSADIYVTNSLHPNVKIALDQVLQEKNGNLKTIHFDQQKIFDHGKQKIIFDIGWRDLGPYFKNRSLKNFVAHWISNFSNFLFIKLSTSKKSVLIFQTGKLDSYFDYQVKNPNANLNIIFPLAGSPSFYLKHKKLTYHFDDFIFYSFPKVSALKQRILKNFIDKKIPPSIYQLFESNLYNYFDGIYAYYLSVRRQLKIIRPDLVLLTAEENEVNRLVAQAAKSLGIKTAVTAHGYTIWGYPDTKHGDTKIFDYCFAFGKKDVGDFKEQKVKDDNILITSHPYFSKFLPFKSIEKKPLKKALILPLDFILTGPNCKIGQKYDFINKTIDMLHEMNIEVIGLKVREAITYSHSGLSEYYSYKNFQIPLYSGYTNFFEVAKNADFIIGPLSTANIESNLKGIPYFTFWPQEDLNAIPYICHTSFDILKIATTHEELKQNILSGESYRPGKSLNDILEFQNISTEYTFENFYDDKILECIGREVG